MATRNRSDLELSHLIIVVARARKAAHRIGDEGLYEELGDVLDFLAEALLNDYSAH